MSPRPHRRFDPLSGRWILVSPQRMDRPWQGASHAPMRDKRPSYDPDCYLCPGNRRANGDRNPDYRGVWVFDNDFPAIRPDDPVSSGGDEDNPLYRREDTAGIARVICFSPDHSKTLADLDDAERRAVVETWCDQSARLGEHWAHVQIFENKGTMMGCSNQHPHGQIWATAHVPDIVLDEDRTQRDYLAEQDGGHDQGQDLLGAVAAHEDADATRIVAANDEWLAFIPYWAAWPFETLILPKRRTPRLNELDDAARGGLASLLGRLMRIYDALFGVSFPYSMGWHGAPSGMKDEHWRVHAHIYPPLLRSAEIRKFMVGYEMMAEPQRDLTPERAAAMLREVAA
ncbi:MAG: UDP-glucose--hexose-1-phosphate uridylyltransferase [Pseudomonadota bacterium]